MINPFLFVDVYMLFYEFVCQCAFRIPLGCLIHYGPTFNISHNYNIFGDIILRL